MLRAQELLIFIGFLIYFLLAALGLPLSLPFFLACILVIGNAMIFVHMFSERLHAKRPFPWNWVVYLLILPASSFAAAFAAVLLLKWMLIRNTPFWDLFRTTWRSVVVICMGTGIVGYLVAQIQSKLREKNLQLEEAVARGTAIIEQQEQELIRAHEIKKDL